jgi:AraC-like DNA-binding protein
MTTNQPSTTPTPSIPSVSVGWIHPFIEILEEVGISSDPILEQADLPSLTIDDGTVLVPTASVYKFVALAARAAAMEDLGLRAGQRFDIEPLLPSPEWAWTRPGVYRSIESFIRVALDSSSRVDMWIESHDDPEPTTEFFYLGTFGPDHPAFVVVEQFMVALMVRWARYGAGESWNPRQVNFRAASVPDTSVRDLAEDALVRSRQPVTSIVFSRQRFMGPVSALPAKGSIIWRRHKSSLGRLDRIEDLAGSLRVVMPAYLPDGSPTIDKAARIAGTSVRTLQRRLNQQEVTYSGLIDDLRHDLAIYLLSNSQKTAATISRELGYRDPAIFTRAFRRWTGQTPSQYRALLEP